MSVSELRSALDRVIAEVGEAQAVLAVVHDNCESAQSQINVARDKVSGAAGVLAIATESSGHDAPVQATALLRAIEIEGDSVAQELATVTEAVSNMVSNTLAVVEQINVYSATF